jgi:O-acetyl-ADP-ribose deacetylase (regulator of RNase III)
VITVRVGDLAAAAAAALVRPITAEGEAATAAARRVELAAGPAAVDQGRRLGELPVGSAAITGAGALPATFLIHAVVRSYEEPVTAEGVRRALTNGLRRLEEWGIESVALPLLGTGAGGLDAEVAADVLGPALAEHLRERARPLQVTLIVENDYEREAVERALARAGVAASAGADA